MTFESLLRFCYKKMVAVNAAAAGDILLQMLLLQVLVLTVLATLVKYTTDENEVRILYEYLAEASVVFPKVNINIFLRQCANFLHLERSTCY